MSDQNKNEKASDAIPAGDKPTPDPQKLNASSRRYITIKEALDFKSEDDLHSMIGASRWLCKGGSCMWVGTSGIGKSTLVTKAAMDWGLGRTFFGIPVKRPLKSILIQAENDAGDTMEMIQGAIKGGGLTDDEIELLNKNVKVIRVDDKFGADFAAELQGIIDEENPDQIFADNYLSYFGGDISSQERNTQFLRGYIQPLLRETGIILHFVQHSGKPSKDKKLQEKWTDNDFAYVQIGSSELTNWPRAINVLTEEAPGLFRLVLAKRGKRAGITDEENRPVTSFYLKHSARGLSWEHVELEEAEELIRSNKSGAGNGFRITDELLQNHLPSRPIPYEQLKKAIADASGMKPDTIRKKLDEIVGAGRLEKRLYKTLSRIGNTSWVALPDVGFPEDFVKQKEREHGI